MTFTSSKRIAKAYKTCDGNTVGFGPAKFKGKIYRVIFRPSTRLIIAVR